MKKVVRVFIRSKSHSTSGAREFCHFVSYFCVWLRIWLLSIFLVGGINFFWLRSEGWLPSLARLFGSTVSTAASGLCMDLLSTTWSAVGRAARSTQGSSPRHVHRIALNILHPSRRCQPTLRKRPIEPPPPLLIQLPINPLQQPLPKTTHIPRLLQWS